MLAALRAHRRFLPTLISVLILLFLYLSYVVAIFQSHSNKGTARSHIKVDGSPAQEPEFSGTTSQQDEGVHHPSWEYDPTRHARNYGLSDEQCASAFPDLFHELDRAARFWTERGGIMKNDVDIFWQKSSGMARLLIYDQQLFIIEKSWTVPSYDVARALALLHSIHRAIMTSPIPLPNIEFAITLGDWPNDAANKYPAWVLSRAEVDTAKWIMPDFGYWSWPLGVIGEYNEVRRQIQKSEPKWEDKRRQAVWRGATTTNPLREALVRVSRGRDWADIKAISWKDEKPVVDDGSGLPLSMKEHCFYRFVVHTEGHSYSGRTKYLLNCHSVSIIHDQEWIEPHSHLYQAAGPDQNVVFVRRDFSDLDENMQHLLRDDQLAQRIAANSARVFRDRYLTPAAQTCYWRRLISTWSRACRFEPELNVEGDAGALGKERGVPFESFVSDMIDPSTIASPSERPR